MRNLSKYYFLLFSLLVTGILISGCSNDSSRSEFPIIFSNQDNNGTETVASVDDLPECNADTEGQLYYIQSTGEFHRFDKLLMAGLIQGGIDGISFQWVFNPDRVDVALSFQELLEIFEKRIHQQ